MHFAFAEVEFVHPVSADGSVKFLPVVKISPFSLIFCVFFLLKLLKLGKIDGVKFFSLKIRQCKFLNRIHFYICLC